MGDTKISPKIKPKPDTSINYDTQRDWWYVGMKKPVDGISKISDSTKRIYH